MLKLNLIVFLFCDYNKIALFYLFNQKKQIKASQRNK